MSGPSPDRVCIGASAAALLLPATLGGVVPPATANAQANQSRPADCELTVDGKTRIRGTCEFRPTGGGGFQISKGSYFAYLTVTGTGVAEASWNERPESTHAQAPLGRLTRNGACWVNQRARICARDLPAAPQAAIRAGQPTGVMLYPQIAPGACLGTDGPLAAGRVITLRNCASPRDKIFTVAGDGRIGIDRQPGLCLAVEAPSAGRPAQLMLKTCGAASITWRIVGNDPVPIRSSDGRCLVIPQMDTPDARFPFAVRAGPCTVQGEQLVRFLIERE